ncbi:MAG TPA: hypothetical protein VGS02_02235 [Acidobacteriaceae bacterium]|nr:hypothetical protein [Acidobacteriaceae bacterium]
MRIDRLCFLAGIVLGSPALLAAQDAAMNLPAKVTAGAAFTIPTSGSGKATLYIVGPGQVLRRDVDLGTPLQFAAGDLYNAGRYVVVLTGGASDVGQLEVTPVQQPSNVAFLAKPSRLPVGLHGGISGTAYLFDAYHNLITTSIPVSFDLANQSSPEQKNTVDSHNGVAWTEMNSAERQGKAKFIARAGGVEVTRIIQEVPGDPCGLTMTAKPAGNRVELQTQPIRDCSGNPVPDGTIVTFTENYNGTQTTADVPIKQDTARVEMPVHPGAVISVASGVVAGNEIRWEGKQ